MCRSWRHPSSGYSQESLGDHPDHVHYHFAKGALCCFVHIAICAGSALAAFLSLGIFLGGPATWTTLLSLPMLFALAQIFLGHFLLETPNFFLRRGNQVAAANSIRYWHEFLL
jgi:hypothetical protein